MTLVFKSVTLTVMVLLTEIGNTEEGGASERGY